jgi:hypothetical protein
MREVADAERIRRFMAALGAEADEDGAAYLTGGSTAVLVGWRASTIDVDLELVPESDRLLRAVQRLKDELRINVELASPAHFVPVPPGWEARSVFITREGRLSFYHFDPYAQAISKVERGHAQDLEDVGALIGHGLVDPRIALSYYERVEPELYRYPAIDAASLRERVREAFGGSATTSAGR